MNEQIADLSTYLIIAGLVILAVEIAVLGFSTFILTFVGIGVLITGGLVAVGLMPSTILAATASIALLSGLSALILWKPLKNLQNKTERQPATSDLVGYQFVLASDVSPSQSGEVKYSGITWKIVADIDIPAGSKVETIAVDVGQWKVKAVD